MASPFRVIVYTAAGAAQGELLTVYEVSDTRSLDKIGTCEFLLAGNDPHIAYVVPGCQFDIFDEVDGYIGRFIYRVAELAVKDDVPDLRIRCDEVTVEMRRTLVGFNRNYYFTPVDQVVEDLVGLTTGWATECDPGIGNTTVTYEGESVFAAVDEMRDRWGMHFRRKTTNGLTPRVLQFGAFGQDSGLVITNLQGQIQPVFDMFRYIAEIKNIRQSTDADEIVNRVVALGAGQGSGQLTLQNATGGVYTVGSAANQDGSLYYYVEDATSILLYGLRPKVVSFSNIRPLSNSDTDITRAKTALKFAAENYLSKHLAPKVEYDTTIQGLRQNVDVGDTLRLRYNGADEYGQWLTVDDDFYLMDITRNRSAKGQRNAKITINSIAERRTSDTDVIVDVVRDISSMKLHIQPQPFWSENTYTDYVQGPTGGITVKVATFKLEVDESVTYLSKALIRFKTRPLYTLTSFDDYSAVYNDPTFSYMFQVIESLHYPQGLTLWVDDVDVSADYGGPWNVGLDGPVDVTCDITELITPALREDHSIKFRCASVFGNAAVQAGLNWNDEISNGIVELNIRLLGIAQAIVPLATN